jgi:uncharacterized protein YndB with AHSA1/START domain
MNRMTTPTGRCRFSGPAAADRFWLQQQHLNGTIADRMLEYQQTMDIAATPQRVWEALIRPADVVQYHLCPLAIIELRPAGRIVYGSDAQPLISGTIIDVVPGRSLVHSFSFDPETHEGTAFEGKSRVDYTITAVANGCRLILTHDQFGSDNQSFINISNGWPMILDRLKTFLETEHPEIPAVQNS